MSYEDRIYHISNHEILRDSAGVLASEVDGRQKLRKIANINHSSTSPISRERLMDLAGMLG